MLLDPGTVISARTGLSSGTISIISGKGISTTDEHGSTRIKSGDTNDTTFGERDPLIADDAPAHNS
jgi:hypothetical protein